MKSSITTTSVKAPFASFGPKAALPDVIRTRETTGALKETPKNENVSEPTVEGTKNVPSEEFEASKNCKEVTLAKSTSEKTAPKPSASAGLEVPGMKKFTSITLLPNGVKRRCGLKNSNVLE